VEIAELKRQVRRAARGDPEAAGLLFDSYYARVYKYAFAKLRSQSDAEDVAAESFAVVLRELDRFKWKGAGFEAWLFRIASNLVADRFRKSAREQTSNEVFNRLDPVEERTPESAFLAGEQARDLKLLMDLLPSDQREVLLLRFAAGLDTNEAARVMGRTPNALRQLQFRALENLRSKMHRQLESR
jgi:RNA polymerase sigma-70 factor, ECF subfamily